MLSKFYISKDLVNLGSVKKRNEPVQKVETNGTSTRTTKLNTSYFQKGDKLEIELSNCPEVELRHLCMLEKIGAIVRCDTDYNESLVKKGLDIDIYRTVTGEGKVVYVNQMIVATEIFYKNWESDKAFIMNPVYEQLYSPLIDEFYLSLIDITSKTQEVVDINQELQNKVMNKKNKTEVK